MAVSYTHLPYANTKNIKIAVATEDTGYQMDDGTTVNMGDSVIEMCIRDSNHISWNIVFTVSVAPHGKSESGKCNSIWEYLSLIHI